MVENYTYEVITAILQTRVQKALLKDVTFSGHPVPTRLTLCNVMELDHKMIGHLIVKVNCLPTNHHKMMAVAANWQQQKESREELFYCSTHSSVQYSLQTLQTAQTQSRHQLRTDLHLI